MTGLEFKPVNRAVDGNPDEETREVVRKVLNTAVEDDYFTGRVLVEYDTADEFDGYIFKGSPPALKLDGVESDRPFKMRWVRAHDSGDLSMEFVAGGKLFSLMVICWDR